MASASRLSRADLFGAISTIVLVFVVADAVRAQQPVPGSGAPPPGTASPKLADRERQEREARLRSLEKMGAAERDERHVRVAVEEVREDFKRLQELRNEIARRLTGGGALDVASLEDRSAEIHKRASRLRDHLMPYTPPDTGKEAPQPELPPDRVVGSLVLLCHAIDRFCENPIFELPGVVDVRESARAGRDLEEIVRLSDLVKRTLRGDAGPSEQ